MQANEAVIWRIFGFDEGFVVYNIPRDSDIPFLVVIQPMSYTVIQAHLKEIF